jgi:hypothetical protein
VGEMEKDELLGPWNLIRNRFQIATGDFDVIKLFDKIQDYKSNINDSEEAVHSLIEERWSNHDSGEWRASELIGWIRVASQDVSKGFQKTWLQLRESPFPGDKHLDVVPYLVYARVALSQHVDHQRRTALHVAAKYGNKDLVSRALTARPSDANYVNARDDLGQTCLHYAAQRPARSIFGLRVDDGNIIRALLQAGADPNLRDEGGRTAAHRACLEQYIEALVQILSSEKLDPNYVNFKARSEQGRTCLHIAAAAGDGQSTGYLLGEDANAGIEDDLHKTPWELCLWRRRHVESQATLDGLARLATEYMEEHNSEYWFRQLRMMAEGKKILKKSSRLRPDMYDLRPTNADQVYFICGNHVRALILNHVHCIAPG